MRIFLFKHAANLSQLRSGEEKLCAKVFEYFGAFWKDVAVIIKILGLTELLFHKNGNKIINLQIYKLEKNYQFTMCNFIFRVVVLEQSTSAESAITISAFKYSLSCYAISYQYEVLCI